MLEDGGAWKDPCKTYKYKYLDLWFRHIFREHKEEFLNIVVYFIIEFQSILQRRIQ
jgi:hypothetical protein